MLFLYWTWFPTCATAQGRVVTLLPLWKIIVADSVLSVWQLHLPPLYALTVRVRGRELKVKQLSKPKSHQQGHLGHKAFRPLAEWAATLLKVRLPVLGLHACAVLLTLFIILTVQEQRSAARTCRSHWGCQPQEVKMSPWSISSSVDVGSNVSAVITDCDHCFSFKFFFFSRKPKCLQFLCFCFLVTLHAGYFPFIC